MHQLITASRALYAYFRKIIHKNNEPQGRPTTLAGPGSLFRYTCEYGDQKSLGLKPPFTLIIFWKGRPTPRRPQLSILAGSTYTPASYGPLHLTSQVKETTTVSPWQGSSGCLSDTDGLSID